MTYHGTGEEETRGGEEEESGGEEEKSGIRIGRGDEEEIRFGWAEERPTGRGGFSEEVLRLVTRPAAGFDHGGGVVDGTRFVGRRQGAREGAQGVHETENGSEHEEFDRGDRATETILGRD